MYISVYLLSCIDIRVELYGLLYKNSGPSSASNTNVQMNLVATDLLFAHCNSKLYHFYVYKCLRAWLY